MTDENHISVPPGEPPVPEDIAPVSAIPPELEPDGLSESQTAAIVAESPGPLSPVEISPERRPGTELWSLLVAAAGWIVPGAGYLLQRRWARAIVGFAGVATLAVIGLKMRGNVFPPHGTEPFDFLGFIADVGSGVFYFFAKSVEAAGPDVSRAAGDYGTRLFATAGILNFLLVLDAVEIARGEKS